MLKKKTHPDILPPRPTPDPAAPLTRPTNRRPDNENIIVPGPYYRVTTDLSHAPLADYHQHGFESSKEMRESVLALAERWRGRKGECIEERLYRDRWGNPDEKTRMLHLKFHDAPGGFPEDAWLPVYICTPIPIPVKQRPRNMSAKHRLQEELHHRMWEKHIRDNHKRH